jgi:predicted HicB family RNase H-like nuclease
MKYKGYTGVAEFDDEAGVIFGHVIGLRDTITFQGESVAEVTQAFRDSVDDYLEFCESRGESPEKAFSGNFVLRIKPELHRLLSSTAEQQSVSLNWLIENMLWTAVLTPGDHPDQDQQAVSQGKVRESTKADVAPGSKGRKLSAK